MIRQHRKAPAAIADTMALAAIVWVAAAVLHEGMGHGLACKAMGGIPTDWSSFHFECDRRSMSAAAGRFVSGAGTLVNIGLATLGWIWWRLGETAGARLAAWILFVINGLTSFGYLIFSAAFGIGDWNGAGVMAGVADPSLARGVLALVGIGGYYAIVRMSARMVSPMLPGPEKAAAARRLNATIWATTGAVSLLAALSAGADWRSTIGASMGVALGGNAGLLSIARFLKPSSASQPEVMDRNWLLRSAALVTVAAFATVMGPSLRL